MFEDRDIHLDCIYSNVVVKIANSSEFKRKLIDLNSTRLAGSSSYF